MNRPAATRAPIGCGGALGLGVAVVIVLGAIVIGHAVLGQIEGAARTVIVFAEIALCVLLGALAIAALGALAFGAQLARLHLAERRDHLGPPGAVRAEVIAAEAPEARIPGFQPRAIQGEQAGKFPGRTVIPLPVRRGDDDAS